MKIRDVMQKPVLTVDLCQPAELAWSQMVAQKVRHLVVTHHGKVVGVLSDGDLGGERGVAVRIGQAVGEMLSGEPSLIKAEDEIAAAARLLRKRNVSCLPVMDGDKLVGIVTSGDLLGVVASPKSSMGEKKRGRKPA